MNRLQTLPFLAIVLAVHAVLALVIVQAQPAPSTSASQPALQDVAGVRIGLVGMGAYNLHNARFLQLPRAVQENIKDYPFSNGAGFGAAGGVFVEFPLTKWLNLGIRASAVEYSGTLRSIAEPSIVGRSDGTFDTAAVFQKVFQANLASAGGELLFGITPVAGLNLYLGARADFAFLKTFSQFEAIVQPSDGVFKDTGERTRNRQSGVLPDVRNLDIANLNVAVLGGLGYEFPVNPSRSWTLEPTAFVSYGLLPVLQNLSDGEYWRVHAVRGGFALRYYPARDAAFDEQEYKLKQLVNLQQQIANERMAIQEQLQELKQSGLLVKLTNMTGIRSDNQEVQNPSITVEQFSAANTVQMLNFVFFNENSSVFPARYKRITAAERTNFRVESLAQLKPLDVYYHVLNILGKRMTERPNATITLTGCNANVGVEKGNRKLSRQRAEAVSDYLQDIWKIAASRISIKDRDLPEQASDNSTTNGQAENRRVEILSDDLSLLQPVTFETAFRSVEPTAIRWDVTINAGPGLKQWLLEISQFEGRESKILKSVEGGNTAPTQYTWNIDEDQRTIPNETGTVDVRLEITDITNRNADAPIISIPVTVTSIADKQRKKLPDTRLDVFTFGVFSSEVSKTTSDPMTIAMMQSIKSKITPQSKVTIEGYVEGDTNEAGSLDSFLGEQRAAFVAAALGLSSSQVTTIAKRRGTTLSKILTNDATVPEGRFYNRAVRVEVRTPVRY
jgi:outer membrane protein OmpA-like peptidoglycan-associated protein